MKISIIVNLTVEGLHYWEDAKDLIPKVSYLSDLHRHIFHISCEKEVKHTDRDIEIIMFKREIQNYLKMTFVDNKFNCCNFGSFSCEDIGKRLFEHFDLISCTVLEDGEN